MVIDYFILNINGVIVPPDMVGSISFKDEEGVNSDRLDISLKPNYPRPMPFDKVTLILVNIHGIMNCGIFYIQSVTRTNNFSLSVSATGIEFNESQKKKYSKNYKDTNLKDIVTIVSNRIGKELNYKAPNYHLSSLNQTDETDISFLERIAKEHDVLFSIKNDIIYFVSKTDKDIPIFQVDITKASHSSITHSKKTQYNSVEAKFWDKKAGKEDKVIIGKEKPLLEVRGAFATRDEAKIKAQAQLDKAQRGEVTGNIEIRGQELYAGTRLELFGTYQNEDNDMYYIESVNHTFTKEGWSCDLEFKK